MTIDAMAPVGPDSGRFGPFADPSGTSGYFSDTSGTSGYFSDTSGADATPVGTPPGCSRTGHSACPPSLLCRSSPPASCRGTARNYDASTTPTTAAQTSSSPHPRNATGFAGGTPTGSPATQPASEREAGAAGHPTGRGLSPCSVCRGVGWPARRYPESEDENAIVPDRYSP
jgi:hypothetical protein